MFRIVNSKGWHVIGYSSVNQIHAKDWWRFTFWGWRNWDFGYRAFLRCPIYIDIGPITVRI
jgi:hypothetical protein